MSSKTKKTIKSKKEKILRIRPLTQNINNQSNIQKLVETMNSVDLTSPSAKLNSTSISDNNGGRIDLNKGNYIKK